MSRARSTGDDRRARRGRPHPVRLADLADHLVARGGRAVRHGDTVVSGAASDSRLVRPGDVFLALAGTHTDGHDHAADAVSAGAAALVVERFVGLGVPELVVPSVRAAAGAVAGLVNGSPADRLCLVGVTGTNGKTTTCQLLRAGLSPLGGPAGQLGTTGAFLGARRLAGPGPSTLEATELHGRLAAIEQGGARAAALEVSSHGLAEHRLDGIRFAVGVFLNLSPEHLDYHGSMEAYFAAKARLFEPDRCAFAVIGVDDDFGRRLAASCPVPSVTFATTGQGEVRVAWRSRGLRGITVELSGASGRVRIDSPLVGAVNAANVAAAYLACVQAGVDPGAARAAVGTAGPPPGRFEVVAAGDPCLAVVDYAHTPDALAALLASARGLRPGRVHVVLGARGGRYRAKRAAMAEVAASADAVVLTTDSPGDEDPAAILGDLLKGVPAVRRHAVAVEPDRQVAIVRALEGLGRNDVLLVTGRGHETAQRFGPHRVAFDDRVATRLALAARALGGPGRPVGAAARPWPSAARGA